VLFHGLDDDSRRKLADAGSTNQQKELPKISKHMKVAVGADAVGLEVVDCRYVDMSQEVARSF